MTNFHPFRQFDSSGCGHVPEVAGRGSLSAAVGTNWN